MTHGRHWMQEIPVKYVHPSRDRHVNNTNLPTHYYHGYDNLDEHSIASSTRSARDAVEFTPQYDKEALQRRHSSKSGYNIHDHTGADNWRPVEPAANYTLVLKSSPKQMKKPVPVYLNNRATGRKFNGLRAWESTGSIASSTAAPTNGLGLSQQHQNVKRSSSSERRGLPLQKPPFPFSGSQQTLRSKNRESTPSQSNLHQHDQPTNGYLSNRRSGSGSHNGKANTENSPSNRNNRHPLTMIKPVSTSTPNSKQSKIVQENFVWQDGVPDSYSSNYDQLLNNNQPEYVTNNTSYYPNRKHSDSVVYYRQSVSPHSHQNGLTHSAVGKRLGGKGSEAVPFTQKTGKESRAHFLQLMKPSTEEAANRQNHHNKPPPGFHSKPPLAPPRRSREEKQQQYAKNLIYGQSRQEPDIDSVIYTEIMPQTLTKSDKNKPEKLRLVRSRSSSPIIYTEVIPSDTANTKHRAVTNSHQAHQVNSNRASMTFGDDFSITAPQEQPPFSLQNLQTRGKQPQLQPKQKSIDKQPQPSQYASNFSISLGTPHLQLRRSTSDVNNNHIEQTYHRDDVKPFPSNSNLEHMLSSDASSSKKSSTMKSALKQPCNNSVGTKDYRSPKRVTIKENSSGRTTPSTIMHTSYQINPASGFTMTPIEKFRDVSYRMLQPQHKFKVVNRNIVLMT